MTDNELLTKIREIVRETISEELTKINSPDNLPSSPSYEDIKPLWYMPIIDKDDKDKNFISIYSFIRVKDREAGVFFDYKDYSQFVEDVGNGISDEKVLEKIKYLYYRDMKDTIPSLPHIEDTPKVFQNVFHQAFCYFKYNKKDYDCVISNNQEPFFNKYLLETSNEKAIRIVEQVKKDYNIPDFALENREENTNLKAWGEEYVYIAIPSLLTEMFSVPVVEKGRKIIFTIPLDEKDVEKKILKLYKSHNYESIIEN